MKRTANAKPPARSPAMLTLSSLVIAVAALSACGGGGGGGASSNDAPSGSNTPAPPPPAPAPADEPVLEAPAPLPPVELPVASAPAAAPSLPSALQLPAGLDISAPGATIRPVAATASSSANQGSNASRAIDGNATTRWESAQTHDQWLQFDFGAKTPVGYMRLTWEAAYGREYAIEASDDAATWYTLRYVSGGRGGVEEFFNLNTHSRYLRIKGVARATQYGYSLFEVDFKAPGSDNSLPLLATSAERFPPAGAALTPAPAAQPPLEMVQFTLADGTLVTRFGMVGRSRHARERGEDWNEIGYGPNETVDGAGNPRDNGPGAHLNFVANYFKNRTWGVEFIDNSRVAGVVRPRLVINHYFQQAQRGGGLGFVRNFSNPNVTGFGWMNPGDLLDNNAYTLGGQGIAACPVIPMPPEGALRSPNRGYNGVIGANGGCSWVFENYPAHNSLTTDANGVQVPNGPRVGARSLRVGDALEFTSSFFSTREAMAALGDSGGIRYYTNEVTYVVGTGVRPWYGVQPRLMNAPLPAETLSGGIGSVSYDYADNSQYIFQQPHNHIGMQNMQRFVEGRRWIHTDLRTGDHSENGNDRNTAAVGLLGPRFNQSSCFGCHINNGRGSAPAVVNQRLDTMAVRTAALDAGNRQVPHPTYGLGVQMNARSASTGRLQDWGLGVRVAGFDTRNVTLADGTAVELRKPRVAFDGPTPAIFSLRSAQPMIGMGLLEAIPDADILARVRTAADADGVRGTANYAYDPESGAVKLGRYGWKASKVSLRHQSAAAALLDMSVTSPVYPSRECLAGPARCTTATAERGLSEDALNLVTRYLRLLAVPAQRSVASGFPRGVTPLAPLDVNPTQVAAGQQVFQNLRCTTCHVGSMTTGSGSEMDEVRHQTIKPYTNLLLHDMGPGLADNLVEGQATGSMWRTPALWGIGYTEAVAASKNVPVGYLHDSRARTLTEAILWHDGEAAASRRRFEALSRTDREAVLAFLKSL